MNVTLPSGVVIEGVPDSTPKDVIKQKAISAGMANESDFQPAVDPMYEGLPQEVIADIEARNPIPIFKDVRERRRGNPRGRIMRARQRAAELEKIRMINPYIAERIESTGGVEAFLVGVGRGLTTVGRGIGLADQEDEFTKMTIEGLKEQRPEAVIIGEVLGETAPFLAVGGPAATGLRAGGRALIPAAKTTGQRALATGAVGATEGGVLAKGKGGDASEVLGGAVLGSIIGGGSELAAPIISSASRAAYRKLIGEPETPDVESMVDDIIEDGALSTDAVEHIEAQGIEIDEFIRDMAENPNLSNDERRAVFESLGLDPTKAQITRDRDLWSEQIEALRREGEVSKVIERQEGILNDAAKAEGRSIGGVSSRANESASNAIIDKAVQLDDEIGNLYTAAREAAPDVKNVRFANAAKTLRENAPSDDLAGGVVKALKGRMNQMGVLDEFKPSGRVSVEQAEELRKVANRLSRSATGEGRYIIRQFKEALDEDALRPSGEDFFKDARKAKSRFERGLSTETKSKFGRRKTSLVRDILEEKIPEDKIADRVITRGSKYDAKSLNELKNYLSTGSEAQVTQGMQAWNDIRSNAFERIMSDAFRGAVDAQGNKVLSRAGLEKGFKSIGPEKFNVLFSEGERSFLRKLAQVSALKEAPPGVRPIPSGPAIEKARDAVLEAMQRIPGFKIASSEVQDIMKNTVNKARDRKVLEKMASDAERAAKEADDLFAEKIRLSPIGTTLTTGVTAGGVAATQQ